VLAIPWDEVASTAPDLLVSVGKPTGYPENVEPQHARKFTSLLKGWSDRATKKDEYHALIRLMYDVGDQDDAEWHLRENLLVSEDMITWVLDESALALYTELFGLGKRKEFNDAIAAFPASFSANLSEGVGGGFDVGFTVTSTNACFEIYGMRNRSCFVRFQYFAKDFVEATMQSERGQILFFKCVDLNWVLGGPDVVTGEYLNRTGKLPPPEVL